MNIIGDLEREWDHLRHPGTPAPVPTFTPNVQTAQPVPTAQENPMSPLLADADKAAKALVAHVATLLANPLVDAIVEDGLGMMLTPGEVTAVVGFVKAIEADRVPALTAAAAPDGADGTPQQVTA